MYAARSWGPMYGEPLAACPRLTKHAAPPSKRFAFRCHHLPCSLRKGRLRLPPLAALLVLPPRGMPRGVDRNVAWNAAHEITVRTVAASFDDVGYLSLINRGEHQDNVCTTSSSSFDHADEVGGVHLGWSRAP
eukprot:3000152-Rhodomonas_salina.2